MKSLFFVLITFISQSTFGETRLVDLEHLPLLHEYQMSSQRIGEISLAVENLIDNSPCMMLGTCPDDVDSLQILLDDYYENDVKLRNFKSELFYYFDEGELLTEVEDELNEWLDLDSPGLGSCPPPPLPEIIFDANNMISFIQKLKTQDSYQRFLDVPTTSKRNCSTKIKNDCWEVDHEGRVNYVSKQNLKIHANCLLKENDTEKIPQNYRPEKLIEAADKAVLKLKTCFNDLNPVRSKEIINKINGQQYLMQCDREDLGRNKHRCGYTKKKSDKFNIVFSRQGCEGYEETIFHEILHMNSHVDNQDTVFHNDGQCHKYDAVYFCSRTCFPKSKRYKIKFTKKACDGCVKNPDSKYLCHQSNFGTPTYDSSWQNCRRGHR